MDLDLVMLRFAQDLTPNGSLAVIDRNWNTEASVWQRILPIIERHTPVQNYQGFDLIQHLVGRGLFKVDGQQHFGPEPWRPIIDECLQCRRSQRGLSRTRMGPTAAASFDAEVFAA